MENQADNPRQRQITTLVFSLGVGCTAVAVAAALLPSTGLKLLNSRQWTMMASTMFVLLGIGARYKTPTRRGNVLLIGLGLCWLGDFLGPIDFSLGAMAFLAAHVFFALAFTANGVDRRRAFWGIGALLTSTFLIIFWLLPHLRPNDIPLIAGYLLAISAMVATAVAGRLYPWRYATLAAAMFYLSDIAVARWQYVDPDPRNAFVCYPLYYGACVLFALMPLAGKLVATPRKT